MTAPVSTLEQRAIDAVLDVGRGAGYVLDFSDATFAAFFKEHGVNIDDARYAVDGTSKGKRLRAFLRTANPELTSRVLAALLEHRKVVSVQIPQQELRVYEGAIARLGGKPKQAAGAVTSEAALLARIFKPDVFKRLPLDAPLIVLMIERMEEAQRCIEAKSYLSAVILCGSVLEGMCLGFGTRSPEAMNRAYTAQYNRPAKAFHEWKLKEWIDVLARVGAISPNVEKYGHALRDFRNYVHPAEQLAHRFSPNDHTARISFHVVVAAADDLVRAPKI